MKNPWVRIPNQAPFVLEADAEAIHDFNETAKPKARIDLTLRPEPFIGRFDAPIVLLNLNPGRSEDDPVWHREPRFASLLMANLGQEASPYPFFFLNPEQRSGSTDLSPGGKWWGKRLRVLIEEVGNAEAAANGLLCVEYFPYHSERFGARTPEIPSQEFGIQLVKAAIDRRAIVVFLRSRRRWIEAVPELQTYQAKSQNVFELNSPQATYVTPRNCAGFEKIVRELKRE